MSAPLPEQTKASVAVIGAGNIGSTLLGNLARLPKVSEILIVDPDTYSAENRFAQAIDSSDVGLFKAFAAATKLRRIRPDLTVTPFVNRVENVPGGRLRVDCILGCVDSKEARAAINRIARRLGVAYIDAGIRADGLMARVDVYPPNEDAACAECGFTQADYAAMSRVFSCAGERREAPSTGASAALGALAASLQAIECAKLLEASAALPVSSRQVVYEAVSHRVLVNQLRRNPACRCDHRTVEARKVSAVTFADLKSTPGDESISIEGCNWVTSLICRGCGEQSQSLLLQSRVKRRLTRCRRCGDQLHPIGFSMLPRLSLSDESIKRVRLRRTGLRRGDIVTIQRGEQREHLELV